LPKYDECLIFADKTVGCYMISMLLKIRNDPIPFMLHTW
jgi:hypothetical protein